MRVGVGIHTVGPALLMLVAEGAGSLQRQLTEIIRDLQAQLADAETAADGHVTDIADTAAPVLVSARAISVEPDAGSADPVAPAEPVGHGPLDAAESMDDARRTSRRPSRPRPRRRPEPGDGTDRERRPARIGRGTCDAPRCDVQGKKVPWPRWPTYLLDRYAPNRHNK